MHDTTTIPNDFLISYHTADQSWAEWIAWQLEAAGYSIHFDAWDVRPGMNFVLELDRATSLARHTIVVLTPAYLSSLPSMPAWSAAFAQDPGGTARLLLPVRVRQCQPSGLLSALTPIELVGLSQEEARARLLAGVRQGRGKPDSEPGFPGEIVLTQETEPNFPAKWPEIWLVPYPANQFFTGREKLLETLHKKLARQKRSPQVTALTQAISGLGGIGKTQTALQYAYTYGQEYRTVLWANASSAENLLNSYVNFAATQRVPGYDAQDQRTALPAVKDWLGRQRDWLLILDNADDLTTIQDYLPTGIHMRGHILLTTRASSLGPLVQTVEVAKMDRRDGVTLLLRRSGMLTTSRSARKKELRSAAETLVAEMDGLPLAIDQAAGYIEERRCSVQDYLQLYQERRRDVLARKNRGSPYYEETVATTWELSFARIREENPAAAELLRFCAFLAPDAIPEELITEGAQYLGGVLGPVAADPLLLNDAIEVLLRYSLVRRNPETKILAIHRLVQVVLRYDLEEGEQRVWAERVIRAVWKIFTYREYETVSHFERYLPQIYVGAELVDKYKFMFDVVSRFLHSTGYYLQDYARYNEAERFYEKALRISKEALGDEHRDTAATLHEIGLLYCKQGRYGDAEVLIRQALNVFEKVLVNQPYYEINYTTTALNSLGTLYYKQERYSEAKELYEQALSIYNEIAGSLEYPPAAITLQNIGLIYLDQEKFDEAEVLFKQALNILENGQEMGAGLIDISVAQSNLAWLYQKREKHHEAQALYQQALLIRVKALGREHPDTISAMKDYADLLRIMGREEEIIMMEARIKNS